MKLKFTLFLAAVIAALTLAGCVMPPQHDFQNDGGGNAHQHGGHEGHGGGHGGGHDRR